MATPTPTLNYVDELKINKLTKAQYDAITPSDTELYFVTDAEIDYNSLANKPTVFTGADGTHAGTSGFVPVPSATDNTKFLRGDSTWAEVDAFPSQSGNAGKFLTTDGIDISWGDTVLDKIYIDSSDTSNTKRTAIQPNQITFNLDKDNTTNPKYARIWAQDIYGNDFGEGYQQYTGIVFEGNGSKYGAVLGRVNYAIKAIFLEKIVKVNFPYKYVLDLPNYSGTVVVTDYTGATQGQVLTLDTNNHPVWTTVDALPSQTGQSGKFLTTDGTDASWAEISGFTALEVDTIWNSVTPTTI